MSVVLSFALKLLAGLAVLWVALIAIMFFMQERLVYLPNAGGRQLVTTPDDIGLLWDDVEFAAADGVPLHGWYVPATDSVGTVIFFHGNAGNISHRLDTLQQLNSLSLDVFIFDYRGYGRSGGAPNEAGINLDAEAAWQYLTETRGVPSQRIVLMGRSLGGAVAARQAAHSDPAALIVESSFTSVPDLAAQLYPIIPVRILARNHHETKHYLQQSDCPVLIAHSRDDRTIPWAHGQALLSAVGDRGSFLELIGGHNDGFMLTGQSYIDGLREFIYSAVPPLPRD